VIDPRPYAALCAEAYDRTDLAVGEAKALSGYTADGYAVAWQGTRDWRQALADLDAVPHFVPGLGYVPRGFGRLAEAAYPELKRRAEAAGQSSVVSGHSMGGSLAILTGLMLARDGLPPRAIIAFAPARCVLTQSISLFGSSSLDQVTPLLARTAVEVQLYRLGGDEVPDLPPGYDIPGTMTQLGRVESLLHELDDHAIAHIGAALADWPNLAGSVA
jgi:hypothetical protein